MKRFTGKLSDYRDCRAKVMRHWCEPILNSNDFDITKEKEKRSMKKRMISLILCFTIGLTCTVWMAPNAAAESQQLIWEDIMQEKVTRYDQDVFIVTDSAEEIAEKQEEMEELIQEKMEVEGTEYLIQQQTTENELKQQMSLLSTTSGEDENWDCPYSNVVGGYTLINPTERLSINVDLNTNLSDIITQAQGMVSAACTYGYSPQGVFRYRDSATSYPMKIGTSEIEEPAWSMISITGYSLPNSYFTKTEQGIYYASREGWTKIIFRYNVCEMYSYWDPNTNNSVIDYFYYDVYMPMDVFIGDGASDGFRKLWSVDYEVQDWFFSWCKDVLGTSTIWPTLDHYTQADACDFDLDLLDVPNITLSTPNTYQNSHGGQKRLPSIMSKLVSQYLIIDLSEQDIAGKIPPELANMGYYWCSLNLSRNKLCGNIPPLTGSMDLDVSYNQLTGLYHDATEFSSLNIDANFISDMQIDYYIPNYLKNGYTSSERQYHLELVEESIEILPDMMLTTEYAKNLTQIVLEGVVQDWDVASELIFEMTPETGFSEYFEGTVQNGFIPKKSGSTSVQLGFTKNNCGMMIEYGDTTSLYNVPVINILEDTDGILRKGLTEGETLQVVVSGGNLQNI